MAAHQSSNGDPRAHRKTLVAAATAVLIAGPLYAEPSGPLLPGDPRRGEALYQACSGCHSIDEDDIGPRHRGVVGRRAGTVAAYAYSPALKASGLVWDAATLDRWLRDPQGLVPGSRMYFSLTDPQKRADIIAYLQLQN
jgi:cytochrome c